MPRFIVLALIHVKIKVALIAAPADRALPPEGDAAHISVDTVIAQAEGSGQFFAAQQFAILHVGALQNIDPAMLAVRFNFREFETGVSVEHGADHLAEDLEEKRPEKRELRQSMQAFPIRLYADPDGFFYQADGFFTGNILNHLQVNGHPREDHPLGMDLFLFGEITISVT